MAETTTKEMQFQVQGVKINVFNKRIPVNWIRGWRRSPPMHPRYFWRL